MTVVAIDGPSGTGKSTLAAALAARLGVPHVDTGAYYRAATLLVLRAGADPGDAVAAEAAVAAAAIDRHDGRTCLDGADVEDEVRSAAVTAAVSAVARHPGVRRRMVALQRAEVGPGGAVVEGRDAATVVVPDAELKVWLVADPAVRAVRRTAQMGQPLTGVEAQAAALAARDAADAEQMARAPGVVVVDTSERSVAALVDELVARLAEVEGT